MNPAGDGLNPYVYVRGNPLNLIDPLGLCAIKQFAYSGWAGNLADCLENAAFLAKEWWLEALVDVHPRFLSCYPCRRSQHRHRLRETCR